MNLAALRARLEAINAERRAIHEEAGEAALNEDQQTRWTALDTEEVSVREQVTEAEEAEARASRAADSRARWQSTQIDIRRDPFEGLGDASRMAPRALIDANLRAMEGASFASEERAHQAQYERTLRRHLGPNATPEARMWGANILARTRDDYLSGWLKLVTGREAFLSHEERAAVAVGTNTQGGYLVPTQLDPTIILTNTGTANAIRPLANVKTLVEGNVWHGVSSAGATASFDAELTEVSDDTPSFTNPSVTLYTGKSFAQASVEAFRDIDALASDMLMILGDARDRLEGQMHATGSGSTQPKGIFTAINADATRQVTSTTAAAIGLVDLQAVYRTLGRRWRGRGTWVMNPLYLLAIQALGTALSASYTTNLTEDLTQRLIGRPVVETDDAPSTQTTTALDNEVIYGDFSDFIIVDKPASMSVEFIPHLFNTANNLPDGRRGWYAYWSNGSDVSTTKAFTMLVDKTSA